MKKILKVLVCVSVMSLMASAAFAAGGDSKSKADTKKAGQSNPDCPPGSDLTDKPDTKVPSPTEKNNDDKTKGVGGT